ncbi:MAG TPA: bifunctional riboflavin kinase/FAD synthetase [Bacillota bacterium]
MSGVETALAAIRRFAAAGDGRPRFLAIGSFDGVHRGHQWILGRLADEARAAGAEAAAMTFDPHPRAVIRPHDAPPLLVTLERRLELMREHGAERVLVVPFNRGFAALEPEAFVGRVLVDLLQVRRIFVGLSFTFGRGGRGTPALLRRIGEPLGITVRQMEPILAEGRAVSSTLVRRALQEGDVETALRCLGRPHAVTGTVLEGRRQGRALGFPTANLADDGRVLWPGDGVYVVRARWQGGEAGGVANLGGRPTVDPDGPRLLEVHLLDVAADLYGRPLEVKFIRRLRDVRRFPDVDALREQISRDVRQARQVLAEDGSLCYHATGLRRDGAGP